MPITPYNAKRGLADPAGVALFSENPSGFVDHELSVDEMPAALLDYQRHRKRSDGVKGPGRGPRGCAVLQSRLGRGFSQYRPGTLMCRIQVLQTHEVPSYIEQLRSQPTEAELLFRELLIGVTRFFRAARRRCRSFDGRRRAPRAGQ